MDSCTDPFVVNKAKVFFEFKVNDTELVEHEKRGRSCSVPEFIKSNKEFYNDFDFLRVRFV